MTELPCRLPHPPSKVGETCPICQKKIEILTFSGMEAYTSCSEYCASVNSEEMIGFLNAKEDEWCVYPCAECAFPLEGEKHADRKRALCIECEPKVRLAERTALLSRARAFLSDHSDTEAHELLKAINESLSEPY